MITKCAFFSAQKDSSVEDGAACVGDRSGWAEDRASKILGTLLERNVAGFTLSTGKLYK